MSKVREAPPPSNGQATRPVPLALIHPSPTNPRKTFDEAALQELAESIKAHGVLQAVLLRPEPMSARLGRGGSPAGPETFELVVGERRYRAAKLAGLTQVPASVRELSDREVLEIQVIENDQRSDVTPLERAEGYAALVERHGVSVEDLARRVGKSESTIRSLLKLRQLPPLAREALERGHLPAATAELIARVPGAADRERLACEVLIGEDHYSPDNNVQALEKEARERMAEGWQPLSYRATRDEIRQHYVVELGKAPFSRKSLDLVPEAGSCDACPKRAGNLAQADLFAAEDYAGVRADCCTDPSCYRRKAEAHGKRLLEEAERKGRKVLTEAEAAKLFNKWQPTRLDHSSDYVDLADNTHETGKTASYKKLVGKQLAGETVVAVDPAGNVHELVPKASAAKVLREEHGVKPPPGTAGRGARQTDFDREAAKRRAAAKAGKAAAFAANALVAGQAAEALAVVDGRLGGLAAMRLRHFLTGLVSVVWSDSCRRVANRRELPGDDHRQAVLAHANTLDDPGALLGLAAELVAAKLSLDWSSEWYGGERDSEKPFWQGWGIDRKKLVKEAEAERKAAKPAKGKKAGKAKPSADGHGRFGSARTVAGDPSAWAGLLDPPDGTNPVTRETFLRTVVHDRIPMPAYDALGEALIATLGQLLDRAGRPAKKGESYTSHLYAYLRSVPGLAADAHALGDALVDAGLVASDGPSLPILPLQAAPVPAGACRVCGCTEADCRQCFERTGEPCSWTSPAKDLCSACLPLTTKLLVDVGSFSAATLKVLRKAGLVIVGEVVGRTPEQLRQACPGIHLSDALLGELAATVEAWVKAQLSRTDDGTEIMPEEPQCQVCTAHGDPCPQEHVERVAGDLANSDVDLLLPLTALPDPVAAALRRAHGTRDEEFVCVGCAARTQEELRGRKKAKAGRAT
jgi:ParB/RepB/Spo0J family partition protein